MSSNSTELFGTSFNSTDYKENKERRETAFLQSKIEELERKLLAEKQKNLFQEFLGKTRQLIGKHNIKARTCFISYAWESESTRNELLQSWLARLSKDLKMVGIKVHLDIEGMQGDMEAWMKAGIAESDYILLIGTPRYKVRSSEQTNGELSGVGNSWAVGRTGREQAYTLQILRRGNDINQPYSTDRFPPQSLTFPLVVMRDKVSPDEARGVVEHDKKALVALYDTRVQQRKKLVAELLKRIELRDTDPASVRPDSKDIKESSEISKLYSSSSFSSSACSASSSSSTDSSQVFGRKLSSTTAQFDLSSSRTSSSNSQGPPLTFSTLPSSPIPKPRLKVDVKVNAEDVQKFLNHVAAGEQDKAEVMLKENRSLALASGTVTDSTFRAFKNITGFQYAVWALDWHMWKMIRTYLSMEEAKEQVKGFTEGSWVTEHGECANWRELIKGYQNLIDNWQTWNRKKINEYWAQHIGRSQLLLPYHVLQKYNQRDRPFYPCPHFDEEYILSRNRINLSDVGTKHGLYRGWYTLKAEVGDATGILSSSFIYTQSAPALFCYDHRALADLYSTRIVQRAQLIATLTEKRGFNLLWLQG